jgi:hypothetical protein
MSQWQGMDKHYPYKGDIGLSRNEKWNSANKGSMILNTSSLLTAWLLVINSKTNIFTTGKSNLCSLVISGVPNDPQFKLCTDSAIVT